MTPHSQTSKQSTQQQATQDQSGQLQQPAQGTAREKLAQQQPTKQLELTPKDRRFIEVSDPWATHNKQAGTAREKLAQLKQQDGPQQAQPIPGSAREKLAQQKQAQQEQQAKPAPQSAREKLTQQQAQRPGNQKTQQQQKQGIER